jgi:polysaccharide biosynthesis protein PslH
MSIKVVSLVSYKFLPAIVGGQKGVALFYKFFSKHVSLVCVTTAANDPGAAKNYEVLPILSTSAIRYINIFYFFTIRRILRKHEASHFLLEHPYYGWLGFLVKRFCKTKLVVHSHNIEGLRWKSLGKWWWKILWRYEKFTHRQADYNFFIHQQDLEYATREFALNPSKCMVVTYGIERDRSPSAKEREDARKMVATLHHIPADHSIFLFNGAFDYRPNAEALSTLLEVINPLLNENKNFMYRLVICGRSIPQDILNGHYPNVVIAGFVEDVDMYFKSADVFLNPLTEGGGIKTKLVEALGLNCNAVSTLNGAIGVDPSLCNGKLFVVADGDWGAFAKKVINASTVTNEIGSDYFLHFYWGYSCERAARFIEQKQDHITL